MNSIHLRSFRERERERARARSEVVEQRQEAAKFLVGSQKEMGSRVFSTNALPPQGGMIA